MGGLPPPSPEEFGPLNCGHHISPSFSAARGEFGRTPTTRTIIHAVGFILNPGLLDTLWLSAQRRIKPESPIVAFAIPGRVHEQFEFLHTSYVDFVPGRCCAANSR